MEEEEEEEEEVVVVVVVPGLVERVRACGEDEDWRERAEAEAEALWNDMLYVLPLPPRRFPREVERE